MARTKIPVEFSSTPGIVDNSSTTAITIDSAGTATFSGDVGIGTSSPSTALDVSGAVTVTRSDVPDDRSTISNEGGLFVISAATGGGGGTYPMLFKTAAVERLRIDASGNTILKTGGAALQWLSGYQTITGDAASNDLTYRTYANHIWKTGTGASSTTDGAEVMRISGGNVGIGRTNPTAPLEVFSGEIATGANKGIRLVNNSASKMYSIRTGIVGVENTSFAIHDDTASVNRLVISSAGNVGIGTDAPGFPLDVSASIGSTIGQTSTHGYSSNRNWAMRTNNYGSANWGGWSLEQITGAGVAPTVARIGVHLNGNVGIKMGGAAGTGGTENPATALHVGGDITVGSAESVGTGAAAAIRFVNDNERARITSNYAAGGGGQMGFWTDSTGGTLVQRAYIKNNGEVNLQAGLRLNGYNYANSDVFKTYSLDGPGSSTTTRTININTYFGFTNGTGGYFMMSLHGWQTDSAAGLIHWHNGGSGGPMTSAYFEPFYEPTGLTVSVAKGTGDYDIDITLTGTHTNTHGWRMNVWGQEK